MCRWNVFERTVISRRWTSVLPPVCYFVVVLGPVLRSPLGPFGDTSIIAAALFLGWGLVTRRRLDGQLAPFAILCTLLALVAISNTLLVSETLAPASFQSILRPIKALVVFIGTYFAISALSSRTAQQVGRRAAYEELLAFAYAAIVVHAVIIVLQFAFPSMRELTYSILEDRGVLEVNKAFRMPGLAGAGGAQLSAVQGLGFLLGIHLMLIRRKYFLYALGNALIIVSLVATGRTGFVVVGSALIYLLWSIVALQPSGQVWRVVRVLVGGVMSIALIVLTASLVLRSNEVDVFAEPGVVRAVDRTLETYFAFQETGDADDRTLAELSKMYVLPSSPAHLLIGDAASYDNRSERYYSDIGYVRQLWGYGVTGLALFMLFYGWMAVLVTRRRVRRCMGVQNVSLALWFLILVFLLNIKEPFFFVRMSFPLTLMVVMGLYWLSPRTQKVTRRVIGEEQITAYSTT